MASHAHPLPSQEPSRILDIMRMSNSKFTTGWETVAPHEAAMGPLSRFADVWSQRNQQHQHHGFQAQEPSGPPLYPPPHGPAGPQQQQQQEVQQGSGAATPPLVDRRQLKLQSAFNGLSLGEVLAGSAKKAPPFPKKRSDSDPQARQAVAAAKPN